jgi:hypothetical protein
VRLDDAPALLANRSDVGTVMARLTGLARIDGPWRELVGQYGDCYGLAWCRRSVGLYQMGSEQ